MIWGSLRGMINENILPVCLWSACIFVNPPKQSDLISDSFVFRPNKESTLKLNLGCIFIMARLSCMSMSSSLSIACNYLSWWMMSSVTGLLIKWLAVLPGLVSSQDLNQTRRCSALDKFPHQTNSQSWLEECFSNNYSSIFQQALLPKLIAPSILLALQLQPSTNQKPSFPVQWTLIGGDRLREQIWWFEPW